MTEWQVIISDLLRQIILSLKTRKQNNKKGKRKSFEKMLLKHGQSLPVLFRPKGATKCQREVALKALSEQQPFTIQT